MKCHSCGADLPEIALYCHQCGIAVKLARSKRPSGTASIFPDPFPPTSAKLSTDAPRGRPTERRRPSIQPGSGGVEAVDDTRTTPYLPLYMVVDRSASMDGEPIVAMNQGMQCLKSELESESWADMIWVSVITFGGDATLDVPLTELMAFYPPTLYAGGPRTLGPALRLLRRQIEHDRSRSPSSYQPIVFMFIGGEASDDWLSAAAQFNTRAPSMPIIYVVLCGGTWPAEDAGRYRAISDNLIYLSAFAAGSFRALISFSQPAVKMSREHMDEET